jgi:predicted CXXCH cytochrome family protein
MQPETAKVRRSRIDLGYYHVPDRQARWRKLVTGLALLAAAAWVVAAPIWGSNRPSNVHFLQQARLASKGSLARPHAIWESTCEACHIPFTPINTSHWAPSLSIRPQADGARCKTCHAGPIHHVNQREEAVPSCAECHRDHRGREASLLAMNDSVCTVCHGDLKEHRKPGAGPLTVSASVRGFDMAHHPEFTPSPSAAGPESGRIKFSHARHLVAGMPLEPGGKPFTFADLEAADRARYGWTAKQGLETPVQLECGSCHQLDGEAYARGLERRFAKLVPARIPGATMLPVVYENHCRACHPLPFEPNVPGRRVRHGQEPRELVDELYRFYASETVKDDPALLRRFVPPEPIPGPAAPREVLVAQSAVADKTLGALKLLFDSGVKREYQSGCVKCHDLKPLARPLVDLATASSLELQPVVVGSLWFQSAVFNHATHRAIDCGQCHERVRESTDLSQHLLPGIAQCVGCHAPATVRGQRPQGGAGVSCVECHRYHNGEEPTQGLGAAARRGSSANTVEQFLSGEPPRER